MKKVSTQVTVSPYQSDPFAKNYEIKLPAGYGDMTHPRMVEMNGKGMRSSKKGY